MIYLAGQNIRNTDELSQDFAQVLSLIKDGQDWFDWATDDSHLRIYYALNEQDQLYKILRGLTESALLKCHHFTIHLDKVLSFEDNDLETLQTVFNAKAGTKGKARFLASKYQLILNEDLRKLPELLTKFRLEHSPIFNALTFEEQTKLHTFLSRITPFTKDETALAKNTNAQALNFAISKASTIEDLIHYTQFYHNCISYQGLDKSDPLLIPEMVEPIYQMLSNISFRFIDSIGIENVQSEDNLIAKLKDLAKDKRLIGFRQRAAFMESIVKSVKMPVNESKLGIVDRETAEMILRQPITDYYNMVYNSIEKGYFQAGSVAQAGWPHFWTCIDDHMKVTLSMNEDLSVCLSPLTELTDPKNMIQITPKK